MLQDPIITEIERYGYPMDYIRSNKEYFFVEEEKEESIYKTFPFLVNDAFTGENYDCFSTMEQAEEAVKGYEEEAKEDGCYKAGQFVIVEYEED